MPADAYDPLPCDGLPCPDGCRHPLGPCAYLVADEEEKTMPETVDTGSEAVERLAALIDTVHKEGLGGAFRWDHVAATFRALLAERDALAEKADKYKWQVRDTCRRAEAAEAQRDALLAVVRAARAYTKGSPYARGPETRALYAALDALSPELREMVDQS